MNSKKKQSVGKRIVVKWVGMKGAGIPWCSAVHLPLANKIDAAIRRAVKAERDMFCAAWNPNHGKPGHRCGFEKPRKAR